MGEEKAGQVIEAGAEIVHPLPHEFSNGLSVLHHCGDSELQLNEGLFSSLIQLALLLELPV